MNKLLIALVTIMHLAPHPFCPVWPAYVDRKPASNAPDFKLYGIDELVLPTPMFENKINTYYYFKTHLQDTHIVLKI